MRLKGMLHRFFRLDGLADDDARDRIHAVMAECGLSSYAAAATQIIVDSSPEPGMERQSLVISQRDRFEVVGQILSHLCRDRAQLVLVDDLQWGNETIELIQYLIRHWYRLPLLVVCTVREEGSEHDAEYVIACANHSGRDMRDHCAWSTVGMPTPATDPQTRIDDKTIRTLAARSAKNPLFTRELISHFIAEGVGSWFQWPRLKPGGTVLPDGVRGVWEARLQAVLGSLDEEPVPFLRLQLPRHSFQLRHLVSVCRDLAQRPA